MSGFPLEWHVHKVDLCQGALEEYRPLHPFTWQGHHKQTINETIEELDDYWSLGGLADG